MRARSKLASFVVFTLMTASRTSQARWAKPDDMDYSVEYRNWESWIHKDGTYDEEIEDEVVVLKDSARMSRGVVRLNYNPEVSKLDVLIAETINGDKKFTVDPHLIEDKPLASSGEGFDQWRQVMIAYPGVDVGSRIHLKYRMKWTYVPAPDFYSSYFYYGYEYQKAANLILHSQLPLLRQVNDPDHYLSISQTTHSRDEYPHTLQVKLRKPILKNVIDEQDPFVDPETLSTVSVASSKDWRDVSKSVLAQYDAILKSPLPPSYKRIADKARKLKDPIEQMNSVTSQLADEIRYLGDWRTLKGQWIPRSLETIAQSKFGDCKDFSASVAAILRTLGMDANVSWVWRGWNPVVEPYNIPSTYRFNHAITRVKVGGNIYWLDGTNVASFAQGIPGDISDRPALLLDPQASALVRVPMPSIDNFKYQFEQRMDFTGDEGVHVDGTFHSTGGDASGWINANFNSSQDSLNFKMVRAAARTDSFRDWKVEDFKIGSRIVSELHGRFSYIDKVMGYRSTAGMGYPIVPPDAVDRLLFSPDSRASDIVIGEPFNYERVMQLTNMAVVGQEPLSCSVDSPWVSITREIAQVDKGLRVRDRLKLKKAFIRHSEYTTPQFGELQRKLVSCFRFSTVIYKPEKAPLN